MTVNSPSRYIIYRKSYIIHTFELFLPGTGISACQFSKPNKQLGGTPLRKASDSPYFVVQQRFEILLMVCICPDSLDRETHIINFFNSPCILEGLVGKVILVYKDAIL
jgi:hypothetical protein